MNLQGLFRVIEPRRNENVLVGIETMDDAAIYRLRPDLAIVVTADYITPVADDAYMYGQVAAANSLSDVYAMGGRPLLALNLCNFPPQADREDLAAILRGGLEKIEESGAVLVGGHTVKDDELKYGLSVVGEVHPERYTPNSRAAKGDRFILTKPVGTGVHITAAKKGRIDRSEFQPVLDAMRTLNRVACETMMEFEVRCATDITGFGLAGHALSVARASGIGIRFFVSEIPRFPLTETLIAEGVRTGNTRTNAEYAADGIAFRNGLTEEQKGLFFDPQTSGGLLIAIRARDADALLRTLHDRGVREARLVAEAFETDHPGLEVV